MDKYPKYNIDSEILSSYNSELIKSGHNRTVYLLTDENNRKYIAKKGHESKDIGASPMNDVVYQSFATSMGLDFIPKIIESDFENDFYIEEYVGDNNVKFEQLADRHIDIFAKQLHKVHSLTFQQFRDFCIQNRLPAPIIKIMDPVESLKINGFDRFNIAEKLCPDRHVLEWLSKNLENNYTKVIKTNPPTEKEAHLVWGDIGENLRQSNDKLFFIDWEFGRIDFGSELTYIKIHSHLRPKQFDLLVKRYAHYSGEKESDLLEDINSQEIITRVNDVVWAAMKWGQAESIEDTQKYKDLTYKRINLAENIL